MTTATHLKLHRGPPHGTSPSPTCGYTLSPPLVCSPALGGNLGEQARVPPEQWLVAWSRDEDEVQAAASGTLPSSRIFTPSLHPAVLGTACGAFEIQMDTTGEGGGTGGTPLQPSIPPSQRTVDFLP